MRRTRSLRLTRRSFLRGSAATLASAPLLGPRLLGSSPNETLSVACFGVGGMGRHDLGQVAGAKGARIVALCDVDTNRLAAAAKTQPGAKTYRDFRKLLDAMERDIDAVVVSTPDHMHGPIAIAAMERGKHVYCQKPIAHNLHECRRMAALAAEKKLVTQMGTQIHSQAAYRTAVATIRKGVLGKIREAHLWVSKSWAGPAQGRPDREDPVPKHLDWDLWLGVAPVRPFVAGLYHPAVWRGWLDFGSGTLGDMGCHIFDPVFSALELSAPRKVVSRGPAHHEETFAPDSDIVYEFPGTAHTTDTLFFRWTDGRRASRPDASKAQLPEGVGLPGAGSFIVGEKGVMVLPHISMPRFYRDGRPIEVEQEKRGSKNHYHEWVAACRGEGETGCPFSYAGAVTEAVLAGTVAGRFKNRELRWDPARGRFDDDEANALVRRTYREGWGI